MLRPSLSVVAVAALLLLAAAPVLAQGPVELRWKFAEGDSTRYRIVEQVKESTADGADRIDETQTTTIDFTQTVTAVDGDGNGTLQLTYNRVQYRHESSLNPAAPLSFDSTRNEDMARAGNDLSLRPFAALVGGSFTLRLSPRGEVLGVEGYTAMLDRVFEGLDDDVFTRLKAALSEQFSDDAMTVWLGQVYQFLPGTAVGRGDEWQRDVAHPVLFVGQLTGQQTYDVQTLTAGEHQTARVAVNTTYEQQPTDDVPGAGALDGFEIAGQVTYGNLDGEFVFNATEGKLHSMDLRQNLRVRLTARSTTTNSMAIDVVSEITGTVTLERLAPEAPEDPEDPEAPEDPEGPENPDDTDGDDDDGE